MNKPGHFLAVTGPKIKLFVSIQRIAPLSLPQPGSKHKLSPAAERKLVKKLDVRQVSLLQCYGRS